jgi:P-type Cu+ transporter
MVDSVNKHQKAIVKITGMSCSHCTQQVEKALQQAEGVKAVRVELLEEKAYIDYDPSVINTETMLQIINDSGYEAALSG